MPTRFSLDRFEGDFAVCYDDENKKYDFPKKTVPFEAGALFTAILDENGIPREIRFLEEETAAQKAAMKKRLTALFQRNKNS